MKRLRLKPSIPLALEPIDEGRWRATFLYDGGRRELELELDQSGIGLLEDLAAKGVLSDDPRLEMLAERRMLIDADSIAVLEDEDELHRQTLLLCELAANGEQLKLALESISEASISIIGLGGIGSNVYDALLRMGFVNFTIVDPDKVARSNLNRQRIYTRDDIGLWKVEAAAAYAIRVNDAASVRSFRCEAEALPAGCLDGTFVVNCADRPSIQFTSAMLMSRNPNLSALLIGGGYFCETSFAGPLLTSDERHLIDAIGSGEAVSAHQRAVGGNTFASAVMPASVAAFDILRFITGLGQAKLRRTMMVFDWRDLRVELIRLD